MSHLPRLVALLCLALAPCALADTTTFGPGEQVIFKASYLGIPAGTVQATVGVEFADRPGVWPIVVLARSDVGLFFFPIRDKLVLQWDSENSRPLAMEMWADENHKHRHLKIQFDAAEAKATVLRQSEGQELVTSQVPAAPGSSDVGSALYLLRTQTLEPGTELSLPVVTPSKQFPMRAVVERREKLMTPIGERSTVRVRLTTDFSGKLKQKSDLIIYFTDDEAHVPVRMEADFALGTVVVEVVEYHSGMKVPPRVKDAARAVDH